ncbi:DsrH/TusB family sulfur metabolism protein [Elongatibacter sediminis]|uniref:DsrH/TusB family sulfur metabolism protein n=1 Tax=Elongatibacter sediminis TaxID=3119006 RepID=A0AAW9R7H9_9GAMM
MRPPSGDAGVLHLVQTAEAQAPVWRGFCAPGDEVLLMDDGVLLLAGNTGIVPLPEGVHLACLDADARARGVADVARALEVELISDGEWVRRVAERPHCLSWK